MQRHSVTVRGISLGDAHCVHVVKPVLQHGSHVSCWKPLEEEGNRAAGA